MLLSQVHTWLVKGRPGANSSSESLRAFQAARRVRLRFEKLSQAGQAHGGASGASGGVSNRAFYSIKFLSIGAQCACNGHASKCTGPSKLGVGSGVTPAGYAAHRAPPECLRGPPGR